MVHDVEVICCTYIDRRFVTFVNTLAAQTQSCQLVMTARNELIMDAISKQSRLGYG